VPPHAPPSMPPGIAWPACSLARFFTGNPAMPSDLSYSSIPKRYSPKQAIPCPPLPAPKLQGVWSTYCRLKSSHPKDHVLPETSSTHQSNPHARMTRGENVWCPGSAPPLVAHLQVHLQATCRPTCSVCEVVPAPNPTPSTRVFTHINHPTSAWPSLTTKHTMKQGFRPRPSIWP
jgi:hypothetical protein